MQHQNNHLLLSLCGLCAFALLLAGAFPTKCAKEVNQQIRDCVDPVSKYAEVLNVGVQNAVANRTNPAFQFGIPKIGEEVFKQLCNLIRRFDDCVRGPRRQCPEHITLRLIDASYGYLCSEGYDVFMANADCLMELDQQHSVKECHDRTLRTITQANQEHELKLKDKMNRMCEALNYFAHCVKEPVLTQCGRDAWKVIVRVLRDTTGTLMPSCPFDAAMELNANNNRLLQSAAADNGYRPTPNIISNTLPDTYQSDGYDVNRPEARGTGRGDSNRTNPFALALAALLLLFQYFILAVR